MFFKFNFFNWKQDKIINCMAQDHRQRPSRSVDEAVRESQTAFR